MLMLALDGELRVYRVYNTHWKEHDLLSKPKAMVKAPVAMVKAPVREQI